MPTEAEILNLLATKHFRAPEWAFVRHVNEGTGAGTGRVLDAVAMGLWPSRGLHLHGIEVKVSRSDWLRELKDPAKADGWYMACHAFWVATPPDVVRGGELPHGWGHLIVTAAQVVVAQKAEVDVDQGRLAWTRVASLLRAATKAGEDVVQRSEINAEVARQLAEKAEALQADAVRAVQAELARLRSAEIGLSKLLQETGEPLYALVRSAKEIGELVRGERTLDTLRNALTSARNGLGRIMERIDELQKL